ncbi:signal recognition particle-docking protein FtsY [uncultured Desulfovibrio sp.]|uniref:signal recognition particle-docking protein FtsY n=1 Tax=uncultured Desulfovibrio sp. TaxID=167968 RepID=UPI0034314CDC
MLAQVEEPASSEQAVEPAAAEGRAEETPCATDEAQAATQAAREQAPEESREQATVREPDGAQQVSSAAPEAPEDVPPAETFGLDAQEAASLTLRLREAEPRLSAWLAIILDGVEEAGDALWQRLTFLLRALEAPPEETQAFVDDFRQWAERMDYRYVADFRSELQYRLALALDMEDEEDERSRLFLKISQGLARTREQFSRGLDALFSSHGELNEAFWEELEELFIMADLGYDASLELVQRLRERARKAGVTRAENVRELLMAELAEIFQTTRRITAVNPPEVVLFIGVNGVGKTTTIAKLAHRARMQGKKVMIAAADTFRAAAIEQLQVWAERVGALFHSRPAGSDPASVAYEAMDRALAEKVDILFVDTAGRLQTKTNLMEELTKIRQVLGKKHAGAPHRTVLVIDATTGQNALSQAKLFKEAAGVDELILTKLDGTAKGGVAIAVAMQEHLPITFVGLGEKLEDLRPFSGEDYARALLGQSTPVGSRTA